jgi:hypothetical protein
MVHETGKKNPKDKALELACIEGEMILYLTG